MRGHVRALSLVAAVLVVLVACSTNGGDGGRAPDDIGKPCTQSAQCPGGRCLSGRCSRTCRDAGDCLPGWGCSPAADGVDVCQCNPGAEVRDGVDNDCNGLVDDGLLPPGQCAAGLTSCFDDCRNLLTDARSCGACAQPCAANAVCSNGACECPAGTTRCPSGCFNLQGDSDHCGTCETTCRGKTSADFVTCTEGKCACRDHRDLLCPDGRCVSQPSQLCLDSNCVSTCRPNQRCMYGTCLD